MENVSRNAYKLGAITLFYVLLLINKWLFSLVLIFSQRLYSKQQDR